MLDITRVTQTRGGYKVSNVRSCPENPRSCQIFADVHYSDGEIESTDYYSSGSYRHDAQSNLDLIEDIPTVSTSVPTKFNRSSKLDDCLESIYSAIGIYLNTKGD